jgi:hypothetical protein
MPDETPGDVNSKEELHLGLKESERVARLRRACEAWTAAFFALRGSGQERSAPTTAERGTRSPVARILSGPR